MEIVPPRSIFRQPYEETLVVVRDHCRLVVDDGIPIMVHWRHIRTSDALQLLLTLEHVHIFSAIVTTTASNQLGMFYVLLLVVNFNCVHERPVNTTSSVSLNSLVFFLLVDPKKHVQTAQPDLQSLNSSSRSHDALVIFTTFF
ncbi:hypothetical protein YC2023_090056 [Brassica napus]